MQALIVCRGGGVCRLYLFFAGRFIESASALSCRLVAASCSCRLELDVFLPFLFRVRILSV